MKVRKALGLILAAMAVVPLMAITYGVSDGTTHPNVGALLVLWPSGARAQICSGTLISPTVFLTAAHCTSWMEAQVAAARGGEIHAAQAGGGGRKLQQTSVAGQ